MSRKNRRGTTKERGHDGRLRGRDGGVKWSRCTQSGKRRYENKGDALVMALNTSVTSGSQRTYECPHCNGWHVTSQTS